MAYRISFTENLPEKKYNFSLDESLELGVKRQHAALEAEGYRFYTNTASKQKADESADRARAAGLDVKISKDGFNRYNYPASECHAVFIHEKEERNPAQVRTLRTELKGKDGKKLSIKTYGDFTDGKSFVYKTRVESEEGSSNLLSEVAELPINAHIDAVNSFRALGFVDVSFGFEKIKHGKGETILKGKNYRIEQEIIFKKLDVIDKFYKN